MERLRARLTGRIIDTTAPSEPLADGTLTLPVRPRRDFEEAAE
jgi:hypothetical protein